MPHPIVPSAWCPRAAMCEITGADVLLEGVARGNGQGAYLQGPDSEVHEKCHRNVLCNRQCGCEGFRNLLERHADGY